MENGEGYDAVDIVFNLGSVSFFLFFALLQFTTTTITRVIVEHNTELQIIKGRWMRKIGPLPILLGMRMPCLLSEI